MSREYRFSNQRVAISNLALRFLAFFLHNSEKILSGSEVEGLRVLSISSEYFLNFFLIIENSFKIPINVNANIVLNSLR